MCCPPGCKVWPSLYSRRRPTGINIGSNYFYYISMTLLTTLSLILRLFADNTGLFIHIDDPVSASHIRLINGWLNLIQRKLNLVYFHVELHMYTRARKGKVQMRYPAWLYIDRHLKCDKFPDWFWMLNTPRIESRPVKTYQQLQHSSITTRAEGNQRCGAYIPEKRPVMKVTHPAARTTFLSPIARVNVHICA